MKTTWNAEDFIANCIRVNHPERNFENIRSLVGGAVKVFFYVSDFRNGDPAIDLHVGFFNPNCSDATNAQRFLLTSIGYSLDEAYAEILTRAERVDAKREAKFDAHDAALDEVAYFKRELSKAFPSRRYEVIDEVKY